MLRNKFSSCILKRFVLFYQNHNVSKFCRFVVLTRNKAKQLIETHVMCIDPTNTIFAVVYKLKDCSWFLRNLGQTKRKDVATIICRPFIL